MKGPPLHSDNDIFEHVKLIQSQIEIERNYIRLLKHNNKYKEQETRLNGGVVSHGRVRVERGGVRGN